MSPRCHVGPSFVNCRAGGERTKRRMALRIGFKGLRKVRQYEQAGYALYAAAVAAARDPWLYQVLAVPDTLDGRFDLVALQVFLLVHRLQREAQPGPALAQ